MKRKNSLVFRPMTRICDSMVTVIGPAVPGSWAWVKCKCDCGKEFTWSYARVYRGPKSCGCINRRREVNYGGVDASNSKGNNGIGRKLAIIERDPTSGCWSYYCYCCGSIFELLPGYEHGLRTALRQIAGEECPNYKVPIMGLDRINGGLHNLKSWLAPGVWYLGDKQAFANMIAGLYKPENVVRDRTGDVIGLLGYPPGKKGALLDGYRSMNKENNRKQEKQRRRGRPVYRIVTDLCRKTRMTLDRSTSLFVDSTDE